MEVTDLVIYNKLGNQINFNYDDVNDIISAKMYMEKNSVDTFKTECLYLFEKVAGSNITMNAELNKLQVFNTNDFNVFPVENATVLNITNIVATNLIVSHF